MRKGRSTVALILTVEERQRLESLAHRSRSAAALARLARTILACAEGTDSKIVARRLHRHAGHGLQMARAIYRRSVGRSGR